MAWNVFKVLTPQKGNQSSYRGFLQSLRKGITRNNSMNEVSNEKNRNSKKSIRIYFDLIKKPLTLLAILVVVLILMVVTPVEYLPVVMSLIKAIVKVILIGELGEIDV